MIVLYQNDISIPEWYICKDDWKTDFQEVLFSWWLSMHQITSFPNFPCNMNLANKQIKFPSSVFGNFQQYSDFFLPHALSRQWVCYQTIAGATASKWFWEKQQTSWLGFFRQYVVLQLDYFVQIRWNIFNLYEDKVQKM